MNARSRKIAIVALAAVIIALLGWGATTEPALAQPPACADLVVTGLTINNSTNPFLTQGSTATVRVTIKNQGTCDALTSVMQWKSDLTAGTGPSFNIPRLNSNQSHTETFDFTYQQSGNYTSIVTLDTNKEVDETNENNNQEILALTVFPNAPDLEVDDFTVVPAHPVTGIPTQVNIRIRNNGPADAGPFVVQWQIDDRSPTGPSQQINGLAGFDSVDISFTFAFPNAGDFTSVVKVDTDKTVAESNEDNNMAIFAVKVKAAAPDLVVTGFTINPAFPTPVDLALLGFPSNQPVEGLNAVINITIKNQGNAPAGGFVVQWRSAENAPDGPSQGAVPNLAAGASTTISFQYAFPRAGNFTTIVELDTGKAVAEFNESNNIELLSITVQRAVIDLIITQFKVEPAPGVVVSEINNGKNPVVNRLAKATITVKNVGNAPAGFFTINWKPGPLVADLMDSVSGLNPNRQRTIIFDFTYDRAGTFNTTATVDSTNQVRESNEGNNSKTISVVVEPERADLIITRFVLLPASPVQGLPVEARVTVRNQGNSPAGPFNVQWKPSPIGADYSLQVNSLAVHTSVVVRFNVGHKYNFPNSFVTTATADSTNREPEINEDNNTAQMTITVQRAVEDLIISNFVVQDVQCEEGGGGDLTPAIIEPKFQSGTTVYACITVQNLGNSPAGPFLVEWNPDELNALPLQTPGPKTLSEQVDIVQGGQEVLVQFEFVYPAPGKFRTLALVDAFNTVRETNEDNNKDIFNVVVQGVGPDLVITNMYLGGNFGGDAPAVDAAGGEIDAAAAQEGIPLVCRGRGDDQVSGAAFTPTVFQHEQVVICVEVTNQGNRDSAAFVVEWNADANNLVTQSPQTLSTQVPGLAKGSVVVVPFFYTYVKAGTAHTVAKADAFNNIKELQEGNNQAILDLNVQATGPDLVVTSLTVVDAPGGIDQASAALEEPTLTQGHKATVQITVQNQGNRSAGPFVVEWNPAEGATPPLITSGPATLSEEVGGLSPFQSVVVTFDFTYNRTGGFRTVAKVDAFNNVGELNEDNNLKIENVVVVPFPLDLTISLDSVTNFDGSTPVIRGSTAVATIRVFNSGDYPTGSFIVKWIPVGEPGNGPQVRIDGLNPGETRTVKLESKFSKAGDYTSLAIVDINNTVPETNENNNRSTRSVHVDPRETTLGVSFNNLTVRQNFGDGIDEDAEWFVIYGVLSPGSSCSLYDQTIEDVQCGKVEDEEVGGAGDTIGINQTFNVTLKESTPLLVLAFAGEVDDFLGIPTDFKNLGFALKVWSNADYMGVGSDSQNAQEGDSDCPNETITKPDGTTESTDSCYRLNYSVSVVDAPPAAASVDDLLSQPTVVLPPFLTQFLPENATLPAGVLAPNADLFLPNISAGGNGTQAAPAAPAAPTEELDPQLYLPNMNR